MKRRLSQIVFCALTLITALAGSTPASADHYRQINRLARRIDNTATSIARESRNFVDSPHYSCLVAETHQLQQLACHIRDVARDGCDLRHLQNDVINLGNAYSALDAKLCLIERANPGCNRARRLRRLLDSVQSDIHKMVSSVTCLLNSRPQVLQPQLIQPLVPNQGYDYLPANPDYQYQSPGYGMNYGSGYGSNYGNGFEMGYPPVHGNLSHNEVRYPTVPSVQRQALQRSASLESQLRSMRSRQGATLNLGGGRLSISF
jgi:hypothetical protein